MNAPSRPLGNGANSSVVRISACSRSRREAGECRSVLAASHGLQGANHSPSRCHGEGFRGRQGNARARARTRMSARGHAHALRPDGFPQEVMACA